MLPLLGLLCRLQSCTRLATLRPNKPVSHLAALFLDLVGKTFSEVACIASTCVAGALIPSCDTKSCYSLCDSGAAKRVPGVGLTIGNC